MRSVSGETAGSCPQCEQLRAQLQQALAHVDQLQQQVAQLSAVVEHQAQRSTQLEREASRPDYRKPPPAVDEFAQVPLEKCPHCGGPVDDVCPLEQVIEDIPPVVVRRLRLTTYRGRCRRCGTVRSTHSEQVSRAGGAAGVHVGRHALALAADLNKRCGITMRKTCDILRTHFGLRITAGGLSQALDRIAGKLQPAFDELQTAVRQTPAIHADKTGWWVAGSSAWLWVFTNPQLTLCTIDERSSAVVRRVLSDEFCGVLVSDYLASYHPHPGSKSKCCAHHLKAISQAQSQAPDSAFLGQIRQLITAAMDLHAVRQHFAAKRYAQYVEILGRQLDDLLAPSYEHPAKQRIANHLRRQREHLLTFLEIAGVEPTNNLAKRQLRPAVITRKLSCGNKTGSGAHTFEALASLAATCTQQGRSFAQFVAASLSLACRPPPELLAQASPDPL